MFALSFSIGRTLKVIIVMSFYASIRLQLMSSDISWFNENYLKNFRLVIYLAGGLDASVVWA